jgi:MoaA/NifB/PqqE/SkfB family radical SAM enzyme
MRNVRVIARDILRRTLPGLSDWLRAARPDVEAVLRTGRSWAARKKHLEVLTIETTNICNANCIFCAYQYQEQFRKTRGVMSDEIYAKALNEYKALGGKKICYTPLCGEAFVDPKMVERLKMAKQMGFEEIYLFTNGILLDRIDIDGLLDADLREMDFSLAPFREDLYEQVYRSGGKYHQLIDGLEKLLRRRNERGGKMLCLLAFRTNMSREAVLALPDFAQRIRPLLTQKEYDAIVVRNCDFDRWGGLIKQSDLLDGMRMAHVPFIKSRPCAWTFLPAVLWDGKVRACACRFGPQTIEEEGLLVGDLNTQSLADIWNGEELETVRKNFVKRKMPIVCKNCAMYRPV